MWQAMAAALSIVARRSPAYEHIYAEAPALYLVDMLDEAARKIIEILKKPLTHFQKPRLGNRKYVLRKFNWTNVSRLILQELKTLTSRRMKMNKEGI